MRLSMILSAVDALNPCKNISLTLTDPKIRKRFLRIGFVTYHDNSRGKYWCHLMDTLLKLWKFDLNRFPNVFWGCEV